MSLTTNEAETLIRDYGMRLRDVGEGGTCPPTKDDIIRWATRIIELSRLLPIPQSETGTQ